jgi:SAM-dependent methyltransferase
MSATRPPAGGSPGGSGKLYDREYFERWYRDSRHAVVHQEVVARRAGLAVAVAEYLLERRIRTVLDVGCGEAPWRALLLDMRPQVRYTGVDFSEYAVRRYGARRNIRLGRVGDLGRLGLKGRFDLIVCSDVLHYVDTEEVGRGLAAMARLLGGVAFIELFTREDDTEGDMEGFQARPAALYRGLFQHAGLVPVGLHCYVGRVLEPRLTAFERAGRGRD